MRRKILSWQMGKIRMIILMIVLFFLLVVGFFLYSSTNDGIISFVPENIDYYWHLDISYLHRSGLSFFNWLNNKKETIILTEYWQSIMDDNFPDSKINWQQEVDPYLTGEMAGFKLSNQPKETSPVFVFKLKKPLLSDKPHFFNFGNYLVLTNQTTTVDLLDDQIDNKLINQIKRRNFWERIVDSSFLKVYFKPNQLLSINDLPNHWTEFDFQATKNKINFYSFPKTNLSKHKIDLHQEQYFNYPSAFLSLCLAPQVIDNQWLSSGGQLLLFQDKEKTDKDYLLILPISKLNHQQLENQLIKQVANLFPITKQKILPDQSTIQELIIDQSVWKFINYPSADNLFRLIHLPDQQQLVYYLQNDNLFLSNSVGILENSLSLKHNQALQQEKIISILPRSSLNNEQLIISSLDQIKQLGIKQIILQSFDLNKLDITGVIY